MVAENPSNQPSISKIFKQLVDDFNILISQPIDLIGIETQDKASIKSESKYFMLGIATVLVVYTSLIFLGFGLLFLLALSLPLWIAAFSVAIIYLFSALVMALTLKTHLNILKKNK